MPILQVLYKRKNGLARYDPKRGVYVGYRIDVVVKGKRHRDGGFASRKDAETFIDRLKSEARDRRNGLSTNGNEPRVSALFAKRLAQITHPQIKAIATRVFATFQSVLDGDPKVPEVRAKHFIKYRNVRQGKKDATVHRELAELSIAFHAASEMFPDELEDYRPPIIKRPSKPKGKHKHIITEDEKDRIVANLQGNEYQKKVGRMFEVAWFIGLRYSEVVKLEKAKLKSRTLNAWRLKKDDVTLFEALPPRLVQVLQEAIKASDDPKYIFTTKQHYPNSFYEEMKRAVTEAGLVYGRKLDGVTFHSARHSFVTRAMKYGDIKTVGSLSNHADATMVLHYTHATAEGRKELMKRMYGNDEALKQIYDKVSSHEMSFDEFKKAIK